MERGLPAGELTQHLVWRRRHLAAELRAVLALLVRDYEWEVVDRLERWEPPMLPERGMPVLFWRREEGREKSE